MTLTEYNWIWYWYILFVMTSTGYGIECTIPRHYFEFVTIETISERLGDNNVLSDIVGVLHALGHEEHIYMQVKPTKIIKLELRLHENKIVKFMLWKKTAIEFENLMTTQLEKTTIVAITSTTVKMFRVSATINEIDDTFGWHYIGCEKCMKKLKQEGHELKCPSCETPSKFKIMFKVYDETAKATLTLFDQEAQKLLNTTAQMLLQQHANTSTPSILQNLCHRTLIFEIKLSAKNLKEGSQICTVSRTFVPTAILEDPILKTPIKQESISRPTIQNKEDPQEEEEEEEEGHGRGNDGANINGKPYKKKKTITRSAKRRLILTSSDDEAHIKGNSKKFL
ncbi:uncharacterized protein LOC127104448 [Lathyrus oleraceus]|uniref:uncharacterized protein LOC127104448 n=1 Tax=Pisum sativum TaxID=3888 RepID=UPI0021D297E4|nr:uncharacterized protein LOC127104448 [Pisum sativum]